MNENQILSNDVNKTLLTLDNSMFHSTNLDMILQIVFLHTSHRNGSNTCISFSRILVRFHLYMYMKRMGDNRDQTDQKIWKKM